VANDYSKRRYSGKREIPKAKFIYTPLNTAELRAEIKTKIKQKRLTVLLKFDSRSRIEGTAFTVQRGKTPIYISKFHGMKEVRQVVDAIRKASLEKYPTKRQDPQPKPAD
jgi:hypothetical protein